MGKVKESYPYIINVGVEKDNLQPYLASPTKKAGIKDAEQALQFYTYTEVVYMPEHDVDINKVVWRSWEGK